jgi:hypothetical protein
MLVDDRETPPELSEARRFVEAWERRASAELRAGAPGAVDAYLGHGRVAEGNRDEMLAACYAAWKADVEAGKSSLMLAVDNATVAELNRLARAERVAAGQVAERGLGPVRRVGGRGGRRRRGPAQRPSPPPGRRRVGAQPGPLCRHRHPSGWGHDGKGHGRRR